MYKIGFIGLGRIGYNLAGNIGKRYDTYIWNRTQEKSNNHHNDYNTNIVENIKKISECDIIFFCLPTYNEVNSVIDKILPNLKSGTTLIDCTSSDYQIQRNIYDKLKLNNIHYFDAPVSGGPEKAKSGEITCMIGGDEKKFNEIEDVFKSFSKPQYVGKIGDSICY